MKLSVLSLLLLGLILLAANKVSASRAIDGDVFQAESLTEQSSPELTKLAESLNANDIQLVETLTETKPKAKPEVETLQNAEFVQDLSQVHDELDDHPSFVSKLEFVDSLKAVHDKEVAQKEQAEKQGFLNIVSYKGEAEPSLLQATEQASVNVEAMTVAEAEAAARAAAADHPTLSPNFKNDANSVKALESAYETAQHKYDAAVRKKSCNKNCLKAKLKAAEAKLRVAQRHLQNRRHRRHRSNKNGAPHPSMDVARRQGDRITNTGIFPAHTVKSDGKADSQIPGFHNRGYGSPIYAANDAVAPLNNAAPHALVESKSQVTDDDDPCTKACSDSWNNAKCRDCIVKSAVDSWITNSYKFSLPGYNYAHFARNRCVAHANNAKLRGKEDNLSETFFADCLFLKLHDSCNK